MWFWGKGEVHGIYDRQVSENLLNKGREIYSCFINLQYAFHRINREDIGKALERRDVGIWEDIGETRKRIYTTM